MIALARRRRFLALPTEPGPREIVLRGRPVAYTLKRSPHAASWRLEYDLNRGLVVVLPADLNHDALDHIFAIKQAWILKRLAEADEREVVTNARRLRHGGPFLLGGEDHLLVCDSGVLPGAVLSEDHTVRVGWPAEDTSGLRAVLLAWLKRRTREILAPVVAAEAAAMKLEYRRFFIRDQRTRWASCSTAGNLNFNCRLAMAPGDVVRYLVVHELAHLRSMRHGKRFWALVAKRCPDYRAAERWLKENESLLNF